MNTAKKKSDRKPSWQYADLAWKIPTHLKCDDLTPQCHLPAKLLLTFLGKCANNNGESWHGYASIRRHTGLSRDSISRGLIYLRKLGVLSWQQGGGIRSNRYALNLSAMQSLAARHHGDNLEEEESESAYTPSGTAMTPSGGLNRASETAAPVLAEADRNSNTTLIEPKKERKEELESDPVCSDEMSCLRKVGQDGTAGKQPASCAEAYAIRGDIHDTHRSEELPDPGAFPEHVPGKWVMRIQGRLFFGDMGTALRNHPSLLPGKHWILFVDPRGRRTKRIFEFIKEPDRWIIREVANEVAV